MNLQELFPNLSDDNHHVTSPRTISYNCVAWAANDTRHWWQPGAFWPVECARNDHGIGTLIAAFQELGYETCEGGELESNFLKVALYGTVMMYTHVARQLSDGTWTSKLGQLEDISHDSPEVIEGSDYGFVVQFMKMRNNTGELNATSV